MTSTRITWPRTVLGIVCAGLLANVATAQDKLPREDVVRIPAIGQGLCVSNVFQSNMVLQRDKPIRLWGWAGPGETVTVSFVGQTVETKAADDRSWEVTLESVPAHDTPQTLSVKGKDDKLELQNILVGDVWVLGGQSNMEFDIVKVDDGELEAVSANFPRIRLLTVPRGQGFESVRSFERLMEWSNWSKRHFSKGNWEECTPETVREFSAIGYVFGRRLHMATRVPIGLIDASVGGTTVETWTPENVIAEIDGAETKTLMQTWADKIAEWDAEADLAKRIENYERNKQNREKQGNPLPADSKPPSDLKPGPVADRNRPGYCYASMIRPLEGLSVSGAVFHQGFNNCFNGSEGARMYRQVFGPMITSWRSAFGDEKLPFCVISLCTAGEPQTWGNFSRPMYDVGPLIREAQHQTYREFRDAGDETIGFVSSFDLRKSWYHPQIKVPAGERAAKWAIVSKYELLQGRGSEQYWLPTTIDEVIVADGTIRLTLSTNVKTADDSDGRMLGFAVAGEDRVFHPATVEYYADGVDDRNRPRYRKNMLVLSSPHVAEPVHYRYAWARNPMANLVNDRGIPLATQRSDDWILEETPLALEVPEGIDARQAARWASGQQRKELQRIDTLRRLRDAEAVVRELTPTVEAAKN